MSLRTRLTLVMVGVVAIAIAITGVITLPAVRASAVAVARERVAAQVEVAARLRAVPDAVRGDAAETALGGTLFALVADLPDGEASGPGASYATDAAREALASGQSFSGTAPGVQGAAIVEARTTDAGTGVIAALPLSDLDPAVGRVTGRVLLALLLGAGIAVLAAVLLARWLSRPLARAAAAARRLTAGERNVTVAVGGPREIAEVQTALATLDGVLAASEGRQREFLLSISHELRTPLTAIRGYGEALADGVVKGVAVKPAGRTIVVETERLDRFVADLLELARLEADDFGIRPGSVDLAALAASVEGAWTGTAATAGVSLAATGSGAVVSDAGRVRQVVDGLVENALRATPSGGRVALAARTDAEGAAVVEVADSGPGFAADDLAHLFDRGVVRSRYAADRPVGTGLGLSIAARLVSRLGGTVSARNGDGGGAVFTVRVPPVGSADPVGRRSGHAEGSIEPRA